MSAIVVNTAIMFGMLIVATAMVGYLAVIGRLTSRAVFVLMPAAVLVISVLTLLADANNPLLPYVAMTMAGMAVLLLATSCVLLVLNVGRVETPKKSAARDNPMNTEPEA